MDIDHGRNSVAARAQAFPASRARLVWEWRRGSAGKQRSRCSPRNTTRQPANKHVYFADASRATTPPEHADGVAFAMNDSCCGQGVQPAGPGRKAGSAHRKHAIARARAVVCGPATLPAERAAEIDRALALAMALPS